MSTTLPLFRRALADSWRGLAGWTVGLIGALFLYLPLYPSIGGNGDLQAILDSLPPELIQSLGYDQITSGPGYVQASYFGLLGFILITIAAVGWGSGAIAGDEENGQLELTLAHGVIRGQLVAERTAAVFVKLLWLAVLSGTIVLLLDDSAELGIAFDDLVAGSTALLGLTFLTAAAAIALGGMTGRRSWALGAGAGIAVYGYALNALGNQSADLEWLHAWSPYSWAYAEAPLTNGWVGQIWALYLASAVLLIAGWLAFRVRDIAV